MRGYTGRLLFALLTIGVVAGLGAAAFLTALQGATALLLGGVANYVPTSAGHEPSMFHVAMGGEISRWMLLLLPAAGGLISGAIIFTWAPEAEGHGTDAAIEAYHFKDGAVRKRVPFLKAVSSAITIGTGGSGGREGPIAQIGAGFGAMLSDWLGIPRHKRRVLMAAGMAAGVGAIFHAPLAGAIFAAEVLYRGPNLEPEVLFPAFTASIIAYSVFGGFFGFEPLFITPDYRFDQPLMLVPYAILAGAASLGAILYTKSFYGVHRLVFGWRRLPSFLRPAVGGLATGIVGFFIPEAIGTGYGVLQICFNTDSGAGTSIEALPLFRDASALLGGVSVSPTLMVAGVLALIALAKIATTSFSIGSGGSGGVFGPAVVIGGALGAATGYVCQALFPSMPIHPGAFAIVGMAGFFAAAANTPISTIIMVSEMTGNYDLLLPSMFVCVLSYFACRRFTLYEKQLGSPSEAPAHLRAMGRSFLGRVPVAEVVALIPSPSKGVFRLHQPLEEVRQKFSETSQSHAVVVNDAGYPLGVISREVIETLEVRDASLFVAADLLTNTPFVTSEDSLLRVFNLLAEGGVASLPVVDADDFSRVLAVVGEDDLVKTYAHLAQEEIEP